MSELTTYALPAEPDGPVWDRFGNRWDTGPLRRMWYGPNGDECTWGGLLLCYGPLTTAPPWKPEVGGTVETEEQYAAMPRGSIVASSYTNPYMSDGGYWFGIECVDKFSNLYMARVSRTILRVGWVS